MLPELPVEAPHISRGKADSASQAVRAIAQQGQQATQVASLIPTDTS